MSEKWGEDFTKYLVADDFIGDWGSGYRIITNELNTPQEKQQMKNNSPINISTTDNGFIVSKAYRDGGYQSESLVFQSMKELQIFLTGHFTFRADKIKTDTKSVPLETN